MGLGIEYPPRDSAGTPLVPADLLQKTPSPDSESKMTDVKIMVSLDGSLRVDGPVPLVDHEGKEIPTKEGLPFFLCRCGASKNKPFCDGSHKRVDFDGS
jgi:hypothetical protein